MHKAVKTKHRGIVVTHTHWDRAWYLPFQTFRVRLVRMVDRLLDLLETEPRFEVFTLDGQTVLLDDYLAIRPENEARLRALVEADRLQIGPWYTLPDLFLAGGEAVIRNLQRGRAHAEHFGGGMSVGYLPDPFGYFAQMAQVLQGFGLDTCLFMRGMSAEMKETCGAVFDWTAPDGSSVLAVYQRQGYFPAAALGHPERFGRFDGHVPQAGLAEERIAEALAQMAPLQEERTLLFSNGFDHMPEQPALPDLLAELNERMQDVALEQGTLPAFVDALKAEEKPHGTYEGDLLGNADHPVLQSVYSARMYLKQQNHRAQHLLAGCAEPLSAWMAARGRGEDARPFLDKAWTLLLKNHAHDDLCGCSVDAVHEDDETRFRQTEEIAETLLVEHLEHLWKEGFVPAAQTGERAADVFVFNPHPFAQRVRVEARVLFPHPDGEAGAPLPERLLAGWDANGQEIAVTTRASEAKVARSNFLETTWGRRYDVTFTVDVPPMGYHLVHLWEDGSVGERESGRAGEWGNGGEQALENEHYRVSLEKGSLVLREKETGVALRDLLRFEYQLDAGDTYSFGPVPDHGPWQAALVDAQRPAERPDALRLKHRLIVPAGYDRVCGAPEGETTLDITTDVWLTPHRALAFSIRYENTAENGRLRVTFPVGFSTRRSLADSPFRLASRERPRGRTPESAPKRYAGYPGELDYPTHHQGDFVIVEGADYRVWVANRGLPEYELIDPEGETRVAVTLHRAVGMLSVEGGRIRRCQAEPSVPVPGAQCRRPMHAALAFGVGACSRVEAARRARAFACPAWAREMPYLPHADSNGSLPRKASLLDIDNPAVQLSAFKPAGEGTCALRLYNCTAEAQEAHVRLGVPASAWCPADLRETWDEAAARPVEGRTLSLTFGSHQIRTLLLRA